MKQKSKIKRKNSKKHNKTIKKKKTFFKNYDLYSDANPKDTIRIKYDNITNLKKTIKKLERLYKNGTRTHKRIVQCYKCSYSKTKSN